MANKRTLPKEKELLAPPWVTTYSDLISLLVTFFVLLFTFSTMEQDRFRRVKGSLGGGLGAMTPERTQSRPNVRSVKVPAHAKTDPQGVWSPARRRELELREDLKRMAQDPSFNTPLETSMLGDGVRIRFDGDRMFAAGTTILLPEAEQILTELARLVRSMPVTLTVEAHVDSRFSQLSRYKDSRTMTREMALNVAEMLLDVTRWSPTRVSISPMGDSRPADSNESPTGRQRNRRVEILVARFQEADGDV